MQTYLITPDRKSQSTTVCSYADWQSRHGTVSIAFCYRQRLDHQRLRDSLSRVLSDYQDYAGRIRMDGSTMYIDHGEQGVPLEIATSSEPYETLTAQAERGKDRIVCPPMSRRRTLNGRDPLLMVRLTETADGCILGVTWHHSVGELASTLQLMLAWSKAYSNERYAAPPDVLDRAKYLDEHMPDPTTAVSAMRLISSGEFFSLIPFVLQKRQRVDFDFGWDQLEQLQAWAKRDAYVGPYDALCAHASGVLRQLVPERPVEQLALAVNYRKRVGLPDNIIGNMISTVTVDLAPSEDQDSSSVAHALRKKLSSYASAHADYHATRRFLSEHAGRFQRMRVVPSLVDPSGTTWIVTNVAGAGIYDVGFDGLTPALWCVLTDAPLPLMTAIFDRPERKGITLSMQLPLALAKRASDPEARKRMSTPPSA